MNWFETVKRYHELGYYDDVKVGLFVAGGKITADEYEQITGKPYEA